LRSPDERGHNRGSAGVTVTREVLATWTPQELFVRASEQELDPFLQVFKAAYVLLVPLPDSVGELASGFAPVTSEGSGAFLTDVLVPDHELTPIVPSVLRSASLRPAGLPIAAELLKTRCHALPLHTSGDDGTPQRVTLGRGHENSVVLRHRTVSRLHGWFELDEDGELCVHDAGSTNHTFVNGTRVNGPVEIHPGCCLRFGSVDTFLYRPKSLWHLLRQ
jgi:hypothetical protein